MPYSPQSSAREATAVRSQCTTTREGLHAATDATKVNTFFFLKVFGSRLVLSHVTDRITLCELKGHSVFCSRL